MQFTTILLHIIIAGRQTSTINQDWTIYTRNTSPTTHTRHHQNHHKLNNVHRSTHHPTSNPPMSINNVIVVFLIFTLLLITNISSTVVPPPSNAAVIKNQKTQGRRRIMFTNIMKKRRTQKMKKKKKKNKVDHQFDDWDNNRVFSAMLPKGNVPPSGSSSCHNDYPNSVASICTFSRNRPQNIQNNNHDPWSIDRSSFFLITSCLGMQSLDRRFPFLFSSSFWVRIMNHICDSCYDYLEL